MQRTDTLVMEPVPRAASPSPAGAWGRLVLAPSSSCPGNIDLCGEGVTLGRSADLPAGCAFKDRRISTHHCRITRDADKRIWIEDLSANGTFLNGVRIGKGNKSQMQFRDLLVLASASQAKKEENFYAYVLETPTSITRQESDATEPDATIIDSPVAPVEPSPVRTRSMARSKSKSGSGALAEAKIEAKEEAAPLLRRGSSGVQKKRKAEAADEASHEKEARKDSGEEKKAQEPAQAPPAAVAAAAVPAAADKKRDDEENAKATLDGMEADLTCTICQELFYRCVGVLPCLHNFCAPCYGAWRKRSSQCPVCRQRVKDVHINHSMRNMVAVYQKQFPDRNRDPQSLLDLDAAGDLTEDMLKGGKLKTSHNHNHDDEDEDEEDEDGSDGSSDSGSGDGAATHPPMSGPIAWPGFAAFGAFAGPARPLGFGWAAAAAPRCRQCLAAGADGYRCNLDGTARHFFCKSCYQPFPDRSANPPPNAAPVRCEFCNGYFCHAYWGCTAAAGKRIAKLTEIGIADDIPDTSFSGNREEKAVLKVLLQKQGKTADQAFKAVLALIDAGTVNAAHNGRAVLSTSVACEACAAHIWGMLAYEYRTRLIKKEEMPADIAGRPDCHWGKNCRTVLHNLAHAKRFNHVCEQTKFS